MRSPFSLYKYSTKSGVVWYARFYDESGKVYATRSTGIPVTGKKGKRVEAHKRAEEILVSLREQNKSPLLIPYLESFWTDDSPYVRAKRIVDKKPLSALYVELNALGIKTHVSSYEPFKKVRLSELTPGMLEDWKVWMLEERTGPKRTNDCLHAMRVAVRYKVSRGEIEKDPFKNVKKCHYEKREKGILSREEVKKVIKSKETDLRVRLAIQIAVLCGLRRGELRGLQWKAIDQLEGLLHVRNNYIDQEGAKGCKAGSERTVPLPEILFQDLDTLRSQSPYSGDDHYVLFSLDHEDQPCTNEVLRCGFKRMMKEVGISYKDQKERNLTLHGMRHSFVTLARLAGISDIVVQALAGHKSADMMNHYSHAGQVIDFDDARKKMEDAGIIKAM